MSSIRSIPGWREMSGAEILDYLLEVVAVPSGRGRLTHAWVAENIGLAAADLVYAEINKVSPPTALRFAAGNGIDTSAALWKQQAEAVAIAVPSLAANLVTLRDFEKVWLPRWKAEGYETEPTLQSVTAEIEAATAEAAKVAMAEQFRELREQFIRSYSRTLGWLNSLENGTAAVPSWTDLKNQMGG